MGLLRQGDRSEDVRVLQAALTSKGYPVPTTGYFGDITLNAVKSFQSASGLKADGLVGPDTKNALESTTEASSDSPYSALAGILGITERLIKTIAKVESNGNGFLSDGRPKILFERHVFYRLLKAKGIDADSLVLSQPDIVNTATGGYQGGSSEYDRLQRASVIDDDTASMACSWGAFQIMGEHWASLGYPSVVDFVEAQNSVEGQLHCFGMFIKNSPSIVAALQQQDWAKVARLYNGPAYAKNSYDTKLESTYNSMA